MHVFKDANLSNPDGFKSIDENGESIPLKSIFQTTEKNIEKQNIEQLNELNIINSVVSSKTGFCFSEWKNPLIKAMMPSILVTDRMVENKKNFLLSREIIVKEIQQFHQSLNLLRISNQEINRLSYLLCSYIDEKMISREAFLEDNNISFLVQFHEDSNGGKICFNHLESYMRNKESNLTLEQRNEVLTCYYLILSLGFKGKYFFIERGEILLNEVKDNLWKILYQDNQIYSLSSIISIKKKKKFIYSNWSLFFILMIALLSAYAISSWFLHESSRKIKQQIAAWQPPLLNKVVTKTNTLPHPLQNILREGWLQAKKHPEGWLLVFTSDGAFELGKATLTEDYVRNNNIERLGDILLNQPGNLVVIGHTDNIPFRNSAQYNNQILSENRAKTIANIIESRKKSIDSPYDKSITTVGKGDSDPIASNATPEGRKSNRRVDILWQIDHSEVDLDKIIETQ